MITCASTTCYCDTGKGTVKLGDFGVSKQMGTSEMFASTLVGTPGYLAPEIWQGCVYDEAADLWCLGCVLNEPVECKRRALSPSHTMDARLLRFRNGGVALQHFDITRNLAHDSPFTLCTSRLADYA